MILAFDTYYFEDKAKTVCVAFEQWKDEKPIEIYEEIISGVEEYEPGAFYKRELPCIMSLLQKIAIVKIDCIVVDGFVVLDDLGKNGLGGYLYELLEEKIPIVGVAKSGFRDNQKHVLKLYRGGSVKPLFITAKGVNLDKAFDCIASMHGKYRNPTILQILDTKTKENCKVKND
ncbi:endonuclease V [Halosquirtibacter xylanolyticus]|uniref:endonuclease V n=1 Tax=Halosquirtibacter xylanolyticus TaxID=3374599 RepID=UPI003747D485|nr:endonuclease V [Prolixibacteraceae bacterium]